MKEWLGIMLQLLINVNQHETQIKMNQFLLITGKSSLKHNFYFNSYLFLRVIIGCLNYK